MHSTTLPQTCHFALYAYLPESSANTRANAVSFTPVHAIKIIVMEALKQESVPYAGVGSCRPADDVGPPAGPDPGPPGPLSRPGAAAVAVSMEGRRTVMASTSLPSCDATILQTFK